MKTKMILIAGVCLLISGCASRQQQVFYTNKNIPVSERQKYWSIHHGDCLQKTYAIQAPPLANCPTNSQGFASGYCAGSNIAKQREYNNARNNIYHGCMTQFGYTRSVY